MARFLFKKRSPRSPTRREVRRRERLVEKPSPAWRLRETRRDQLRRGIWPGSLS